MRRAAADLAALSRLLDVVLELPPQERAAWIDRLDAANETFKSTLRQMLFDSADLAVESLTSVGRGVDAAVLSAVAAAETPQSTTGGRVGPYDLIRELGSGGMGSVWLARRVEGLTRRVVVLKLPHPGLFHAELAKRIARERDILEGLAHPHIARLYEAGVTPGGQPYLAIEYVEGTPINLYCDSHQLGIRARITLMQQVLGAVQYAHAQLVLHRDVKPANILVTDAGHAMLLDFGIAKLMTDGRPDDSALTRIGGRALTPDYASPEQIAGQPLGTGSDVYSLGILLYELLAGVRPYDLDKAMSIEHAFAKIVVARPSALVTDASARRALQGDLDTIVVKALKVSPTERYATVAALAEDLDRYLRGDSVLARRDTAWYRIRKFSLRNKLAVGAVAAVVAALAVGLTIALAQARKARLEAARAEQVKSFALSMLDSADSDAGAGAATTAIDLLQAARRRVETELTGQPMISVELMTAVGYGLLGQDRAQDAADLLEKAVQLSLQTAGPEDVRTVEAQVVYGEALYDLGKNDEAIAVLTPLPERAHRLRAVHAQVDAWRTLSNAQLDAGDEASAIASAYAAVAAIPAIGPAPGRRILLDAKQAHLSLANVLANLHKPGVSDEARLSLRYAAQSGNSNEPATLLDARTLLGIGLVREGHAVDGLRELKNTYADARTIRGAENRQTLVLASLLGTSCLEAGDVQGALSAYQDSFDGTMRHQAALGTYAVAWGHFGLALALDASDDDARAMPHIVEAIKLFTQSSGPAAQLTLRSRSAYALMLARTAELADSDREFAAISTEKLSQDDRVTLEVRLARLRGMQGRHQEAVNLARHSVAGSKSSPSRALQARSLAALGAALLAADRSSDAINPLRQSAALFAEAQVPRSPEQLEVAAMLDRAHHPVARADSQHPD
jgi:tetratricopeptide (TPR) repeat protein